MDVEKIKSDFSNLKTREDVAKILEINDVSLRYFLYKKRPENLYNSFKIKKSNGTYRVISAPDPKLKQIQKKLATILTAVYEPKVCSYGFILGKNIVGNAQQHIKRYVVFNVDLKDFFTQIHFGRIRGMLINPPYSIGIEAATTIAQIVCYKGSLPQGAPTSPIITNMICVPLDNALMQLAKKHRCIYTRYADDITFSSYHKDLSPAIGYLDSEDKARVGEMLCDILNKHSFQVNEDKVTLRTNFKRQEVTGLTVNRFPNLRRSYIKQLRAILYSCEKRGVYNSAKIYIDKGLCKNQNIINCKDKDTVCRWFKSVLKGKIGYIKQVKGDNSLTYLHFAEKMNSIFSENIFDISLLNSLNNKIERSTFVLEGCATYEQGSAFYLSGIGLITSYHVTENGDLFKVYNHKDYNVSHKDIIGEFKKISSDKTIDYAIYRTDFELDDSVTFSIGDSRNLKIGDTVTIVGYPNHIKGNSPYIQTCCITSKKSYFDFPFFSVGGRVIHGASGGVVLNEKHEAIGILKGGIASTAQNDITDTQGFVALHYVLDHYDKATK